MVSCTSCREAKGRTKVEASIACVTIVQKQVIRPSSVLQTVEQQKERERRETEKIGRDGQKVKVGTRQAKVGSNKDQQE